MKGSKNLKSERFNMKITKETKERLFEAAPKMGISVSSLVMLAINEFLNKQEQSK